MVLAHAGGIDELLLIVLPWIVFMITYRLARGRIVEAAEDDAPR
jgi:hypothetical protein